MNKKFKPLNAEEALEESIKAMHEAVQKRFDATALQLSKLGQVEIIALIHSLEDEIDSLEDEIDSLEEDLYTDAEDI